MYLRSPLLLLFLALPATRAWVSSPNLHHPCKRNFAGLDTMMSQTDDTTETEKDNKDLLKDASYEAFDALKEISEDAKEEIDPDRFEEEKSILEKAKDKASSAKDTVKEAAESAKQNIGHGLETLGEKIAGDEED